MKTALLALPLLFAAAATPALALDDHAETASAELTIETPIETLMANDAARAVVLEAIPELDQHPAYDQFKAMSLKAVQPFSGGNITDEMLAQIAAGLAKLG